MTARVVPESSVLAWSEQRRRYAERAKVLRRAAERTTDADRRDDLRAQAARLEAKARARR